MIYYILLTYKEENTLYCLDIEFKEIHKLINFILNILNDNTETNDLIDIKINIIKEKR